VIATQSSGHLVDTWARLTIMSVGNEESSEIGEIDASVSAQRGTVPQLSGRRLKHVDGLCGKWVTAGTKRRGIYKKRVKYKKAPNCRRVRTHTSVKRWSSVTRALPSVLCRCRVHVKYRPEIRFPSSSAKSSVFFVGWCEQRGDHRSEPHGIEHGGGR
jgi:hypothetical protein